MAKERRSNNKQICLECQRLKAENEFLSHEIDNLKAITLVNNIQGQQEDIGTSYGNESMPAEMKLADRNSSDYVVTKDSTLVQKIAIFRSLFQGREDVYVLRYERKRDGKPGYTPACKIYGSKEYAQNRKSVVMIATVKIICQLMIKSSKNIFEAKKSLAFTPY